jgi:hypothetical protein
MHYTLPTPGTLIADKYRIEELLGRGGMGAVFRARHELMDSYVALKLLHPEFSHASDSRQRFVREARAAARIRHPNVVQVFDVGLHEGTLFMVMELLQGLSFEAILAEGALPVPRALSLLINAMRGVAEAHAHGIVHRDIKPENIFVTRDPRSLDGVAKVLDFGISKLTDESAHNLTQTGEVLGTPEYMSFEHMSGARDLDARSDVYSFGVLLYRALTGISPFDADSVAAIAVRVATHRPPPPGQLRPGLPSVLDEVVMKAMAFDRNDRYPNMLALIEALTHVASSEGYLQALPPQASSSPNASGGSTAAETRPLETVARGLPEPSETRELATPALGNTGPVVTPARGRRWPLVAAAAVALTCAAGAWGWRGRSSPARIQPPAPPAHAQPASAGRMLLRVPDQASLAPPNVVPVRDAATEDWTPPAPTPVVPSRLPAALKPSAAPAKPRPARKSGTVSPAAPLNPVSPEAPSAAEPDPPAKSRSGRMRATDF